VIIFLTIAFLAWVLTAVKALMEYQEKGAFTGKVKVTFVIAFLALFSVVGSAVSLYQSKQSAKRREEEGTKHVGVVSQLRSDLDTERDKVKELQKRAERRGLSDDKRLILLGALEQAPKAPIDFIVESQDAEAMGFASELGSIFSKAGYNVSPFTFGVWVKSDGSQIVVKANTNNYSAIAATPIVTSLRDIGLDVRAKQDNALTGRIVLYVRSKITK
jgi:hypothetical protein